MCSRLWNCVLAAVDKDYTAAAAAAAAADELYCRHDNTKLCPLYSCYNLN